MGHCYLQLGYQWKNPGPGCSWAVAYMPPSNPVLFCSPRQDHVSVQKQTWPWRRGAHMAPPQVTQPPSPSEQAANRSVWPYLPPSRTHALLLLGCSRALGGWHCFFFPFFFPFEKKSIEEPFGKRSGQ